MLVNIELIFDIANIVFLIGTLFLIHAIYKNRNVLRGFQPVGSLLTLIAMSFIQFNYYQMDMWKSFIFSLPTTTLWLLASVYSIRNALRKKT
jgi:hypothetical protein